MSFKGKLFEKAAEQIVQAAASAVGKHISQKAVDHTLDSARKKAVGGYGSMREAINGALGVEKAPVAEPFNLTENERRMIHHWYTVGMHIPTPADEALHARLCKGLF